MNFDFGTIAGVFGVILTILFFVIGYRQTIGARNERAAAANRQISETLLRRLTLEPGFSITCDEVERLIAGVALESRVKRSDVFSTDELWVILFSRVAGSDYVTAKQRKPLLEKINRSFESAADESADIVITPEQEAAAENEKRNGRQFFLLGLISTLMAGISLWIAEAVVLGPQPVDAD